MRRAVWGKTQRKVYSFTQATGREIRDWEGAQENEAFSAALGLPKGKSADSAGKREWAGGPSW
jgi:hypothetical protein